MKALHRFVAAFALCAALVLAPPLGYDAAAREKKTKLEAQIDGILEREVFHPAIVAVDIRDLGSGATLYARNRTTNVKPASTNKLLTTAAILDALGPEARVTTTIETTARVDARGRVLGDVYFVGRGDPNLSSRFDAPGAPTPFDRMAAELWDAGIRSIEGRLVGHDGLFPGETIGDNWTADDLVWSYGAEISALSAFDNSMDVRIEPGEKVGDPVVITPLPRTPFVDIVNETRTLESTVARAIDVARDLGSRRVRISGGVPVGDSPSIESFAVPEPALFAATLLSEALARRGITVEGTIESSRSDLPKDLRVLASYRGRTLADEIKVVNKESQNLHAEILLRRLGVFSHGTGDLAGSLEARGKILRDLGAHFETAGIYDGSGLSRATILPASAEVELLAAMARHPHAKAFRDSLPIAGVDGSLRRRMKGTAAEGRVFAKTGSIRHVSALAGYIDTVSGRRLVFSMIVNHHTRPSKEATDAMDEICALLAAQ